MKKAFISLFYLVFFSIFSFADVFNVVMYNDDKVKIGKMERSMSNEPYVLFDDDMKNISITADRRIENAQITITNSEGMVVASAVSSLSETAIYIQIPDFVENEKYKIEIAYDDIYLYGYINQ